MNGLWGALFVAAVIYFFIKKKKALGADSNKGSSHTTGSTAGAASEEDLTRIINKVGRHFIARRYDAALQLINENIGRYEGEQKAQLLNQRGGLHSIKGEHQASLPDYKEAYELDDSLTNLTNYVEVLVRLKMYDVARPIAEQGLKNPNVRGSERKTLELALNG